MTDSDFRPGSDEEWADLLRQLRQPEAQPRPYFYARVRARLAAEQVAATAWLPAWARRPAYAALLGVLVLAVSGDGAALPPAAPAGPPSAQLLNQPSSPPPR